MNFLVVANRSIKIEDKIQSINGKHETHLRSRLDIQRFLQDSSCLIWYLGYAKKVPKVYQPSEADMKQMEEQALEGGEEEK
jgi:hypothetical protein